MTSRQRRRSRAVTRARRTTAAAQQPSRRLPLPPPAALSADGLPEAYRARCEEDLVAMVPLVLGFHPHESVVLLTFGRAGFHARVDLPDLEQMLAGHDVDVAESLAHACRTNGADRAAVVVYTGDHELARRQGERLMEALHDADVDVVDVLRVHDGRWFEPLVDTEGLDGEGTPFDLRDHRFTARHVFEGHTVAAAREDLAADLVGGDDRERDQVLTAVGFHAALLRPGGDMDHAKQEARWVRGRVDLAVTTGKALTTGEAARMLTCLARPDVRDAAWVDLRRGNAAAHVELWRDLVRRSPEETLTSACAMLALASYVAGDGALAWVAIDHAGEPGHDHSLVRLVADALVAAVPPSQWPEGDPELLPLLQ